jgi:hypothetical protein
MRNLSSVRNPDPASCSSASRRARRATSRDAAAVVLPSAPAERASVHGLTRCEKYLLKHVAFTAHGGQRWRVVAGGGGGGFVGRKESAELDTDRQT